MVPKNNRPTIQARDAQVITGIGKHLQSLPSLQLMGSAFTPAELVKLLQSRIDSAGAVASSKANFHSTVAADRALSTRVTQVVRALRQYVLNAFGSASPVLADFGFAPPARATRTPEQKAASAAKASATRKARHTMGPKQKKAVKGNVSGITVTPIVAPQPAAPAPTPVNPAATSTGSAGGTSPHTA